ncbi:auxin-responsive protein SAUR40 [Punica granatum]|uniref:Uncharacterized protein n=2 Tax=Punica granatum TaxID=22663 RepID=A0A2I0KBI6_PUNGR|nr:auxin-responsive protein SAUR40 [Punica granatum]PKI65146.1 hypothetical protein CRG98_014460 [Punica granatum]
MTPPSLSLAFPISPVFPLYLSASSAKEMKIITKSKLLRTCLSKLKKTEFRGPITSSASSSSSLASESCCGWAFLPTSLQEESIIPRDVPRGHLAVYVGENYRRFVIEVTLLDHPLFQALLDLARDEYGFTASSKLCIPCDETMFIEVVRCAGSPQDRRVFLCR